MSFVFEVRERYFPVLEHAVQDIHHRLSEVNYLPAKEMTLTKDEDVADAMVEQIFTPADKLATPVYVQCDLDNDQWFVHYKKDGVEADVYTRVLFHADHEPIVDPVIVVQPHSEM